MCNLIDNLILQMFKRDILKSLFLFEIGVFSLPTVTEKQTNEICQICQRWQISTLLVWKIYNILPKKLTKTFGSYVKYQVKQISKIQAQNKVS